MPNSRLALALAASLAVAGLAAPAHAARPVSDDAATSHRATSGQPASADRRTKKWRLSYTVTLFNGGPAFDYAWRVTTRHGSPVKGAKVYVQYKPVPHKWANESNHPYVTDATGTFHVYACNQSFGLQRMYIRPTKKRAAVIRTFQLRQCGT